jgi:hypothetical protein
MNSTLETTINDDKIINDSKTEKNVTRRSAVRTIVNGVIFLALAAYLPLATACKKQDNTPQEVTITFDIADQMTGVGRTITKQGYTNASMTVTAAETEISGVVAGYISVQDLSSGNILGSGNGSASFQTGTRTNYKILRFHDGPGLKELYDTAVAQGMRLYTKRDSAWGRKDGSGATGDESVWSNVFSQVNNALQNPFPLASVRTGGTDDFYGFDTLGGNGGKVLQERRIYVDPRDEQRIQIRTGLSELIEYLFMFNNINGKETQQTICNPGDNQLNDTGRYLIRFCAGYLKD